MRENSKLTPHAKDQVLGCMVGGAVGDALGYAVEFASYDSIVKKYGEKDITRFKLDRHGVADFRGFHSGFSYENRDRTSNFHKFQAGNPLSDEVRCPISLGKDRVSVIRRRIYPVGNAPGDGNDLLVLFRMRALFCIIAELSHYFSTFK